MVPAQPMMDIKPDCKLENSTNIVIDRENKNVQDTSDGRGLSCTNDSKETINILLDGKATTPKDFEDVEVDIVTCTKINEIRPAEVEDPDATEYSSSFADTASDPEKCSGLSEAEMESQKKKLTNHWRSFVRPLMWRCQWTELKIKQIKSRASKYAREIAACEEKKHSGIYQSTFEENKKSNPEGTSMIDDFSNTAITDQHANGNDKSGVDNDEMFIEFGDGDKSLEQVLRKIEIVHSRVHKLKNQLDILMSKNASKFSSSENLSLLAACDAQTSSAPSPTFSAGGDLVMPESAMSGFGEAVDVPDIIESTVGLLSAADVTFHQPQIGDSSENIVDNVLIQNQAAEGEQDIFMATNVQLIEKHVKPERGEEGESSDPFLTPKPEPDSMEKNMGSQGQPVLKSCLAPHLQIPRNKRKRGERKAGHRGWNKQCSVSDVNIVKFE
uniref:Uncharacterized protein n=1 Tax=Salix viminalis TaxID=40686 RepID=A0A6N2MFZ6_SALVM